MRQRQNLVEQCRALLGAHSALLDHGRQYADRLVGGELLQEPRPSRQPCRQRGGVAHQGDGRTLRGLLAHCLQLVAGLFGALFVARAGDGRLPGRCRAAYRGHGLPQHLVGCGVRGEAVDIDRAVVPHGQYPAVLAYLLLGHGREPGLRHDPGEPRGRDAQSPGRLACVESVLACQARPEGVQVGGGPRHLVRIEPAVRTALQQPCRDREFHLPHRETECRTRPLSAPAHRTAVPLVTVVSFVCRMPLPLVHDTNATGRH